MKRLLTYLSIGLVAMRIAVLVTESRFNDSLNSIFEAAEHRQLQIDSLKVLRIQLEQADSLNPLDRNTLQKIKSQEKRLLGVSLRQYQDAKVKVESQLKILDAVESIVDTAILLTIGMLIFYLIRTR